MKEEIELGEQDEVTYAIVARLPAYALWNLLDCRDEDGVPLMTVIEWLRFIRIYLTRVLLRARWIDKVCQGRWRTIVIVELYDRPPEALMGHVGVLTTIGNY